MTLLNYIICIMCIWLSAKTYSVGDHTMSAMYLITGTIISIVSEVVWVINERHKTKFQALADAYVKYVKTEKGEETQNESSNDNECIKEQLGKAQS